MYGLKNQLNKLANGKRAACNNNCNELKNESVWLSPNWWFDGRTAPFKFTQAVTLLLCGTCHDNEFHMPTTQNSKRGCDTDRYDTYSWYR